MMRIIFSIIFVVSVSLSAFAQNQGASLHCSDSVPSDPGSGTSLMLIPDSLRDDVQKLLSGKYSIQRNPGSVNPDEKILVRGDTVNLIIKDRNLGRFDRGLFNYLFIPKGVWQFGLTASYGEYSTSDVQLLDLMNDFDFSGNTFSIKPYIAYTVKNNLSVGLRLGYTSSLGNLNSLNVDFDDDLNFSLKDIEYRSESYTAAILARQYIGLGRESRFGVYNEVELAFSSGSSRFTRPYDGVPKLTKTTDMDARLTFSPGLCIMMMKNVSFNISFGVFGYYIHNERQTVDGEKAGNRFTSGASFRFNIFNINFGVAVHI